MRKLASIQIVRKLEEIPGADNIEIAHINDWKCVVKKGELEENGLCVYHEIDCLLPMGGVYDFLANRGTSKSELEDGTIVEGYRLKTIKLRGQLSQGLALPISIVRDAVVKHSQFPNNMLQNLQIQIAYGENPDVSHILGIHKYERPMNAQLRGLARGNFPSFLRKSDQERCQNLRRQIWDARMEAQSFEVTVKLDGSSMTAFYITEKGAELYGTEARFGVCSRNLELKETEDNAFWAMARRLDLEAKLKSLCEKERKVGIALQGELVAPNIQGNFEGVDKPEFFVYNMFDIGDQRYAAPSTTRWICEKDLEIKVVPLVNWKTRWVRLDQLFNNVTEDTIIQEILNFADGPSALGGTFREGVVFKSADGQFSFKAISNSYLLKEND